MLVAAPKGAAGDRKVFVQRGYVSKTAVGQPGFRGMDE
jgi:cytochrome oxidase assembly protein ShyY1